VAVVLLAPGVAAFAQRPDFDGDGFADLAIGVPAESFGGTLAAGAVQVLYGTAAGISAAGDQVWDQNKPNIKDARESQDQFGAALAWGDFDGDGFDDLAVGVPFENVDRHPLAGAVNVLYGSGAGLSSAGNQFWSQNSAGVPDAAEEDDSFGTSLAAGDFDDDGFDDLAVGAPFESFGGKSDAGAVHVLYGSGGGLSKAGTQRFTQDSPGIADPAETFDLFGTALAAGDFDGDGFTDLAVGVNAETVGSADAAGAVNVIYGSSSGLASTGNQFWTQSGTGVAASEADDRFGATLAAGDFDGDQVDDLAIGAGLEDLAGGADAGGVVVLYGVLNSGLSGTGAQFWSQDSPGIMDVSQADDLFGSSLAAGDFDGDGFDDLAVGAAEEDLAFIGTIEDAGELNVIYGSGGGLSSAGNQLFSQLLVLQGFAEAGDLFGAVLTASDFDGDGFDDLAAGVPFEDLGNLDFENHGAVNVVYGSTGAGLTSTGNQFLNQDTPGVLETAEPGDNFGSALP
jgi:hypothetical protein